jgi:hypothetical protein
MSNDFIADLIDALRRVLTPDAAAMRDILIISGMPEKTENLRYLSFNRHTIEQENGRLEFSAVAVINNRRVPQWRLEGYRKNVSRAVFRWTRNHLDLFLHSLRCNPVMMDVLMSSESRYTLFGILKIEQQLSGGFFKRRQCSVRPVVAVPGIFNEEKIQKVVDFEAASEIRASGIRRTPLFRKAGQGMTGS